MAAFNHCDSGAVTESDKELLVLNTTQDRDAIIELLGHYHIPSEEIQLLLLPSNSNLYASFTDYGFISRAERHYLYDHLISIFCFGESSLPQADPANAFLQMQEHLIADFQIDDVSYYAVDTQLNELMDRIALAYRCSIKFTKKG